MPESSPEKAGAGSQGLTEEHHDWLSRFLGVDTRDPVGKAAKTVGGALDGAVSGLKELAHGAAGAIAGGGALAQVMPVVPPPVLPPMPPPWAPPVLPPVAPPPLPPPVPPPVVAPPVMPPPLLVPPEAPPPGLLARAGTVVVGVAEAVGLATGVAVLAGAAVLLYSSKTAPPWMDEMNPETGKPYASLEDYEQVKSRRRAHPPSGQAAGQSASGGLDRHDHEDYAEEVVNKGAAATCAELKEALTGLVKALQERALQMEDPMHSDKDTYEGHKKRYLRTQKLLKDVTGIADVRGAECAINTGEAHDWIKHPPPGPQYKP